MAGTYYYGACVDAVTDESDIANNCSTSVQVTVSEPEPEPEPDPGAGPDCSLQIAGNEFIVCYIDGYKADAEITRDIVNEARAKFVVKYGRPARMSLQIKLYDEPTDSVRRGRTYYDGSAIHFLTPSSPSADSCCSQLGLRFNETDYHRSTITHEYFHAFHDALNVVASWRWGGWFREGIAHHEGVTAMTQDRWRSVAEIVYRDRTISCGQSFDGAEQIVVTEVYWGGALLMRFLGDTFGEDVDRRLLLSSRMDVAHAITDELPAGQTPCGLFDEFRAWMAAEFGLSMPSAAPTMLTLSAASAPAEGGNPVTVTATLDNPAPANGTTVTLTTGGTATLDTDYTLSSTTITLAAGETAGTVTITVTDDAEDDDGETIVIDAESTSPALTADQLTLTIEDNDGPAPTMLTLSAASAPAEGGNPVTVIATLDNPAPANGMTVTLTTSGTATLDTDYTLSSTTFTLAEGETAGTVTITVTDDAEDDDGETIAIDAESTNPALTADQLTLTIEDNDVTPVPALPLGGAMLLGLLLTLLGAVRMRMRDRTDIARGC